MPRLWIGAVPNLVEMYAKDMGDGGEAIPYHPDKDYYILNIRIQQLTELEVKELLSKLDVAYVGRISYGTYVDTNSPKNKTTIQTTLDALKKAEKAYQQAITFTANWVDSGKINQNWYVSANTLAESPNPAFSDESYLYQMSPEPAPDIGSAAHGPG